MFFGSKKIPELARSLGKGMKELKNATNDIQQEIRDSTKDISKIKDSVDVEKQVKNMITESKVEENKKEIIQEEEPEVQPFQPNTVSRSKTHTSSSSSKEE